MVLKFVVGTLLAVAAAAPATAADWRIAAESNRGVSFIDMSSIAKEGGAVRFDRWLVLGAQMSSGADNLRDRLRFDCATRDYEVLSTEFLENTRSKGTLAAGTKGRAEPDTVLASLGAIACGTRKPEGAAVADPYAVGRARLGKPATK